MKVFCRRIGVHLALLLTLAIACSSAAPLPVVKDAGVTDGAQSAVDAKACVKELGRIAKDDDTETCCAGLFKACVPIGLPEYGGKSCICSTVACGTAAMPPPRDVPPF
jgi:hypothetical protein